MSKRRFGNLLKRRLSLLRKIFSSKDMRPLGTAMKERGENEFIKSQLRDISRFGSDLIVMRMGN